jgi:hypothetical protein
LKSNLVVVFFVGRIVFFGLLGFVTRHAGGLLAAENKTDRIRKTRPNEATARGCPADQRGVFSCFRPQRIPMVKQTASRGKRATRLDG